MGFFKAAKQSAVVIFWLLPVLSLEVSAESRFSLGVFGGYESHDVSFDNSSGQIDLLFEPEDSGTSLGAMLAYDLAENWSVTAEYSYNDADDVEVQQAYGSLSYHIPIQDSLWTLKLGGLAGYSWLEWQEDPVSTLNRDPDSDQWVLGAQAEIEYAMGPDWRLSLRYQYWGTDHKTKISTFDGAATIHHEDQQNILLGLRRYF